jgi:hypothetical protein
VTISMASVADLNIRHAVIMVSFVQVKACCCYLQERPAQGEGEPPALTGEASGPVSAAQHPATTLSAAQSLRLASGSPSGGEKSESSSSTAHHQQQQGVEGKTSADAGGLVAADGSAPAEEGSGAGGAGVIQGGAVSAGGAPVVPKLLFQSVEAVVVEDDSKDEAMWVGLGLGWGWGGGATSWVGPS